MTRREIMTESQAWLTRQEIPSWVSPHLLPYIGTIIAETLVTQGKGTESNPYLFSDENYFRLDAFLKECVRLSETRGVLCIQIRPNIILRLDPTAKKAEVSLYVSGKNALYARLTPYAQVAVSKVETAMVRLGYTCSQQRIIRK